MSREMIIFEEFCAAIAAQSDQKALFDLLGRSLESHFGIQGLQIILRPEGNTLPEMIYFRQGGQNIIKQARPCSSTWLEQVEGKKLVYISQEMMAFCQTLGEDESFFAGMPQPLSWAGAPIYVEQRLAGVLGCMNFERQEAFQTADLEMIRLAAKLLGIALQNLRLSEAESERSLIAETLQEVAVAINYSLDLNETLELILAQLGRVVEYDSASIMLWEGEELAVAAQCGFRDDSQMNFRPLLQDTPNIVEVITHRYPLLIGDTTQDARWHTFHTGDTYIRCWIGVPLIVQSQVIGVLNVDSATPYFYSDHDVALASAFAGQASIAIHNAGLYAKAQQQANELGILRQATLSLTERLETPAVMSNILTSAMSLLGKITELHVFRYEDGKLILGTALWPDQAQSFPTAEPRQDGVSYTVARSGETLVVEDIQHHPLYVNDQRGLKGACIGLPLKISERVVGVMIVSYPEPRHFAPSELRMLHLFADHAAIALENSGLYEQAQAEIQRRKDSEAALRQANLRLEDQLYQIEILQEQLREQAIRDPLTGLFNRRYLNETLEREFELARRQSQNIGIIMIDLDHFKQVNDRFGHRHGDFALQLLGQMIQSKVRRSDIPCRYGGEEFCIVLPGASSEITLNRAEMLRLSFAELVIVPEHPDMHATLSAGVALYPAHGDTPEIVLNRADEALYQAKNRGRNCVVLWESTVAQE